MNQDERNQLVEGNIGLIHAVIKKYTSSYMTQQNPALDYEDLFQTGTIGLIKAADTYDSNKGAVFSTYATIIIRNEIYASLHKMNKSHADLTTFSLDCRYDEDGVSINDALAVYDDEENAIWDAHLKTMKEIKSRHNSNSLNLGIQMINLIYQGYRQREAAGILGIDEKKIPSILSYTRRILRKESSEYSWLRE